MIFPHSYIKDRTEKKRCPLEKSIAEKENMSFNYQVAMSVRLLCQ